jgi:hypothetical protein
MQGGVEEVLVVLEGVHQQIPDGEIASPGYKILPLPPSEATEASAPQPAGAPATTPQTTTPQPAGPPSVLVTDADRLREQYKQAGKAQNHVFGEGLPGSKPPDFTKIPGIRAATPPSPAAGAAPKPATPLGAAGSPTGQGSANVSPVPKPPAVPANAVAPKPKPRPAAPIVVTDPAEGSADPAAPAKPAAQPASPDAPPKPAPTNQ